MPDVLTLWSLAVLVVGGLMYVLELQYGCQVDLRHLRLAA